MPISLKYIIMNCCSFAEISQCATASVFEEQMHPTLNDDDNKLDVLANIIPVRNYELSCTILVSVCSYWQVANPYIEIH